MTVILRSLVLLAGLAPGLALAAPPPWAHAGGRAASADVDDGADQGDGAEDGSFGDFVRAQREAGLRGRALAEAIRAEHVRRGHGPPEGKGWRRDREAAPAPGRGHGRDRG
jgi:hypothetical protein